MSGQEIIEKKCNSYGKIMYIKREFIRNKMYCTPGRTDSKNNNVINRDF